MSSYALHKQLGYDLMLVLADFFRGSELADVNINGCYQTLILKDEYSIRFTKWRVDPLPFYIILFKKQKFIFELDLSMLLADDDSYTWHLKIPRHPTPKAVLQEKLGESIWFDKDYVAQVKEQKSALEAGVNTPKQGYTFLHQANWQKVRERLCDLMNAMIKVDSNKSYPTNDLTITEAPNDPDEFENQKRRVRRGQDKFRNNLLALYDGKCAITGVNAQDVLEAAHIVSHAESGENSSDNGLLLRIDIHKLFDKNLLRINPENYKVVVAEELQGTEYWKLNGKSLRKRTDGKHPAPHYIETRWLLEKAV